MFQDNWHSIAALRHPTDSMKDSKQWELIEEESRWVESQILPPDLPLFILEDEAQRIRAAWSEKKTATAHRNSLRSRFPIDLLVPKLAASVILEYKANSFV